MTHYFSEQPATPSERHLVHLQVRGLELDLWTDRGVFSGARVDSGTLALLEVAPPPPDRAAELLDLGCGYGPIAIALGRWAPRARVWAVDVNARAVELVRDNAALNRCDNVRAAAPEDVPADVRFTAIYSNPPVRIGRSALLALLEAWLARLAPDGAAYLVVQRNLGADSLAPRLQAGGRSVVRLGSKRGYRVLEVRAPSGA